MGKRGSVPFSKKDVPHIVHGRVDIGPVKVGVRNTSGGLVEVNEERGDGIGNSSARGTEDTVATFTDPVDLEIFREVGGVSPLHPEKVDRGLRRKTVHLAQISLGLFAIFVELFRGLQAMRRIVLCALSATNVWASASSWTPLMRNSVERKARDISDVKIMVKMNMHEIFQPFGPLIDVHQRGVNEDQIQPRAARGSSVRAVMVTAQEAEVIETRTPVAYAPPWASTSA